MFFNEIINIIYRHFINSWLFFIIFTLLIIISFNNLLNPYSKFKILSVRIDRYSLIIKVKKLFISYYITISGVKIKSFPIESEGAHINIDIAIKKILEIIGRTSLLSIIYKVENGVLSFFIFHYFISRNKKNLIPKSFLEFEKVLAILRTTSTFSLDLLKGSEIKSFIKKSFLVKPLHLKVRGENIVEISNGKEHVFLGGIYLNKIKIYNDSNSGKIELKFLDNLILTYIKEGMRGFIIFNIRKLNHFIPKLRIKNQYSVSLYTFITSKDEQSLASNLELSKTILTFFNDDKNSVYIGELKSTYFLENIERIALYMPIKELSLPFTEAQSLISSSGILFSKYFNKITQIVSIPENLYKGDIYIGKVVFEGSYVSDAYLSLDDLAHHMIILGQTGSGKSTFVKNILLQLVKKKPQINWLIIDFKGEYSDVFKKISKRIEIKIYTPGHKSSSFKLNLFEPYKEAPEVHAMRIYSIMTDIFHEMFEGESTDFSSQMRRVLYEAIYNVVVDKNKRCFKALVNEIKKIAAGNNSLERTALALLNRLHIMYNGILKNIFTDDMERCITPEYLLKNKVIIDMSYIREKGSTRDIRFLMNMIVKFLLVESFSRGLSTLQNLLVIEEAQFLVPEIFYKRTSADFSTVEDMIHVERSFGIGIIAISTRPIISSNILANAGIKVAFKNDFDFDKIAKFFGFKDTEANIMREIPFYFAIVSHFRESKPFMIKPPDPSDFYSYTHLSLEQPVEVETQTHNYNPPPPYILNRVTYLLSKNALSKSQVNKLIPIYEFNKMSEKRQQIVAKVKKILDKEIVMEKNSLIEFLEDIDKKTIYSVLSFLINNKDIKQVSFFDNENKKVTLIFSPEINIDPIEVYMATKFIELCHERMLIVDDSIGGPFDGIINERYLFKAINTNAYSPKILISKISEYNQTANLLGYDKLIIIVPRISDFFSMISKNELNKLTKTVVIGFSINNIRKFLSKLK